MDHKYINEVDLVGRYLMGKSAPEEIAEFEAHFVDCRECTDHLNTSKALMEGLRIVASENALGTQGYKAGRASWSLRRLSLRNSLALAGVLLLVAAATIVVSNEIRRSRGEAAQARIAIAELERRYEEERQSSSLAEMRHQDSDRDLNTQLARLRAELDKQNSAEMPDDHRGLKPHINLAIFQLESTRGNEPAAGASKELRIPRSPTDFVILISLEGEDSHKAYSATIRDGHGEVIWKESGLKRNQYNCLSVSFNSTFFRDGDYSLTVDGVAGDGSTSAVGEYPLRVVKTP